VSPATGGRSASRVRAPLLGAAGVGLQLMAFPPLGWWPLALLAPWPLAQLAIEAPTSRRAFVRLYAAGLALFAFGSAWLAETTWINLLIVTAVESLYVGLFGWAARRVLRGRPVMPALPVLWVAHEMLRAYVPLSGYPWQLSGQALAGSAVMVQAADLGGVPLLSFVAACGAALAMAWRRGERRGMQAAAGVLGLAAVYGLVRPSTLGEAVPGPRLASVQPGFSQRLKRDSARGRDRYELCLEQSLSALSEGAPTDLLVWPETAWPYPVGEGRPGDEWYPGFGPARSAACFREDVAPLLATGPLADRAPHLLLGVVYHWLGADGALQSANSALYLDARGQRLARYDKHILVPGGEAIPFGAWLPARLHRAVEGFIRDVAGFVVDLVPGPGAMVMDLDGTPFGVTICYENAYGDYGRRTVAEGAAFLVNLSNEAWFGSSSEFDHMELQSILRAVETRRALVRCTYSGITCLVRPTGRPPRGPDRLVADGRDRAVAGVFETTVPLHDDMAPYVLVGDAWGWLCLLAAGLLAFRGGGGRVS
jgi:apolipoprotein N-acyltransferase